MRFLAFGLTLAFASISFAQTDSVGTSGVDFSTLSLEIDQTLNPLVWERPRFTVGLSVADFQYKEDKMSESTPMSGLFGRASFPMSSEIHLDVEYEYLTGEGDYTGQTWGGTPLKTGTNTSVHNLRGLANFSVTRDDRDGLDFLTGLGYRYLDNSDDGPGAYRREITYLYLPLGLSWVHRVNSEFSFGLAAEADIFLSGTVKSHFSQLNPNTPDVTNHQSSGSGSRVSGNLTWSLAKMAVSARPYVQNWHVAGSDWEKLGDTGYVVQEPENDTTTTGLDVVVAF